MKRRVIKSVDEGAAVVRIHYRDTVPAVALLRRVIGNITSHLGCNEEEIEKAAADVHSQLLNQQGDRLSRNPDLSAWREEMTTMAYLAIRQDRDEYDDHPLPITICGRSIFNPLETPTHADIAIGNRRIRFDIRYNVNRSEFAIYFRSNDPETFTASAGAGLSNQQYNEVDGIYRGILIKRIVDREMKRILDEHPDLRAMVADQLDDDLDDRLDEDWSVYQAQLSEELAGPSFGR